MLLGFGGKRFDNARGLPGRAPQGFPKRFPQGFPKGGPKGFHGFPGGVVAGVSEGVSEGFPWVSGGFRDKFSREQLSEIVYFATS